MTTIAYKRGVMACDSCWTDSSEHLQQTNMIKIVRLSSGALLGSAGDNDSRAVDVLLDKVKSFEKLPTTAALAETHCDYSGILVFKSAEAVIVEVTQPETEDGVWKAAVYRANRGCAAVGSGAQLAIGAMSAGVTAAEAVGIACGWDINSKTPVHVVRLAVPKPKVKQ